MAEKVPPDTSMFTPRPPRWEEKYKTLYELFIKYIDHVGAVEGSQYIDGFYTHQEQDVLHKLAKAGYKKYSDAQHSYYCPEEYEVQNLDLLEDIIK